MATNFSDLIDLTRLRKFKDKIVELLNSKADSSHTHTKSEISDFPSSLKNPSGISMTKNGTSYNYDGSSAVALGAFYTPTAAGTEGYVPVSQGSGAPLWKMPDNYAVSSTSAGTVAKTATINNFKLVTGAMVTIKFTYAHTAATAATLNIYNGSSYVGAKTIYYYHGNQAKKDYAWEAGETVVFQYDGSYWRAVASDRFAKRFATLEEKIEGLGGSVSGVVDIPAISLSKNGRTTETLTVTGLTKQHQHGYIAIKKSDGSGYSFLPWDHNIKEIWNLVSGGSNYYVGDESYMGSFKVKMSAEQSGNTLTITMNISTYNAASVSAGDYKIHYELY